MLNPINGNLKKQDKKAYMTIAVQVFIALCLTDMRNSTIYCFIYICVSLYMYHCGKLLKLYSYIETLTNNNDGEMLKYFTEFLEKPPKIIYQLGNISMLVDIIHGICMLCLLSDANITSFIILFLTSHYTYMHGVNAVEKEIKRIKKEIQASPVQELPIEAITISGKDISTT